MDDNVLLSAVIRSLGAAWKALRLYPPASPMTFEVAGSTCKSIEDYLQAEPSLRLDVVREGFIMRGLDGVLAAPGIADLAEGLAMHGVGEVHFNAPPAADELITLLSLVQTAPHELHAQGGMTKALAAANVLSIKVVSVVLSKVEAPPEIPEEEAEKFLQQLAGDPERLAVWLRSLLSADDEGLTEGIMLLATAAGDVRVFGRTLALAFSELDGNSCDRMLEAAIDLEPLREVTTEMLANLSAVEITAAIRGGRFGENVLSMSYALVRLPLGSRLEEILAETESALTAADATAQEIAFLQQMTQRRRSTAPEQPLAQAQPYYASAVSAVALTAEQIAAASAPFAASTHLAPNGAEAILLLLDSARDFGGYTAVLGALARAVPRLFETSQNALALHIIDEIMHRLASTERAWQGLDVHFAQAVDVMCGPKSMHALMMAYPASPDVPGTIKELVNLCGEPAALFLAAASIESEAEASLELAELVLGRRLAELLVPAAPTVDADRAAKLAELFARDGSPRCMQALAQMITRPEDKVRLEVARGLSSVGGQALTGLAPRLLRDSSTQVSGFVARTLSHHLSPEVVSALASRLDELEGDEDLALARDIIGALGKSSHATARDVLGRTATKGGMLRKGRYAEMRQLASDALQAQTAEQGAS